MSAVPKSLAARIVGYEALSEFIPLFPLYPLLFADTGLSPAEISSLLMIWSVTAFVLEVPSGAWADAFSRRTLLLVSSFLSALGFAAWVSFPSYLAFVAGFVLWGASSALASGTFEALVYDELAQRDATDGYAGLIGRSRAAALILNLLATVAAAPMFELGGYALVGAASVVVCLGQALVALSLPDAAKVETADETEDVGGGKASGPVGRYLGMLRAGLGEVTHTRVVRNAVLLVALVAGFFAFDEYFPLLGRDNGASNTIVPLLIAITVAAQAAGSALAGRAVRWRGRTLGWHTLASAVLIAIGALSRHPLGFVPIAVGYGLLSLVITVAEARLQDAITGPARATVTSVSGLLSEVTAIMIYAGFALGSVWFATPILLALLSIPLVVVAGVVPRWLPDPTTEESDTAAV